MTALQRGILARLGELRAGTTMCPGRLTRELGSTLAKEREGLLDLARAGKIVLSQRGQIVQPERLKGPFRVRLKRAD